MNSVADRWPGSGDERVVGVELALDGLVGQHALGPGHLLDLEADGVTVFEHECHHRSDRDPPQLLQSDDAGSLLLPDSFVGAQVDDVVEGELGHRRSFLRSGSGAMP